MSITSPAQFKMAIRLLVSRLCPLFQRAREAKSKISGTQRAAGRFCLFAVGEINVARMKRHCVANDCEPGARNPGRRRRYPDFAINDRNDRSAAALHPGYQLPHGSLGASGLRKMWMGSPGTMCRPLNVA